ncbi:hypothetical protein Pyrfu_1789 [Pyrolobus fumarii 1A]|uniref:Pterin-binding domain-containing protein n=1 Tax=Pyrolobus fumarii (strain DSM 11204 / 1A) TaxID=694429 RepID=G0ECS3_PYRF1|nr:hypothetical protein Pyrfu_1789 [Pyrolobus fumarii 1A]
MKRVLIVTGVQARDLIVEYVREAVRVVPGLSVDVVALPIATAALITTDFLVKTLPQTKSDYKKYDVIMVPGKSSVDPLEASKRLGARVVKGPRSPGELEYVFRLLAEGEVRLDYSELRRDILEIVASAFSKARRLCVDGGACVYYQPGYTLIVEVTPKQDNNEFEEFVREVVEQKPDFIVFGDEEWLNDGEYRRMLKHFVELVNDVPFGVESRRVERLLEALDYGASLVSGLSGSSLREFKAYRDQAFFVLQPFDDQRGLYPRDAHEKVTLLLKGIEVAREYGFQYVLLDPIVMPPPLGFADSIEPYRILRDTHRIYGDCNYPLLFSLASLEDALATDSFPVFLFAGCIGFEVGASVFWIVAKRGIEVSEARAALDVALASYVKHAPPVDLGVDLTLLGSIRGERIPIGKGEVVRVESEVEPANFDRGYIRIMVDRGEIVAEYVEGSRRRVYRGKDGLSIARLVVRDFSVNPEHAVYIGYELARAEIAARLRSGYVQDEKFKPPHERIRGV